MWQNFGVNFDEYNVERIAGILEFRQFIYQLIDRDCVVNVDYFVRGISKEEEVVNLIIGDLISNDVFKKIFGREGYVFFLKFEQFFILI